MGVDADAKLCLAMENGFIQMKAMYFVAHSGCSPQSSSLLPASAQPRDVPVLPAEDLKALASIRTSGAFALEKSVGMYAGVKKLRPGK